MISVIGQDKTADVELTLEELAEDPDTVLAVLGHNYTLVLPTKQHGDSPW